MKMIFIQLKMNKKLINIFKVRSHNLQKMIYKIKMIKKMKILMMKDRKKMDWKICKIFLVFKKKKKKKKKKVIIQILVANIMLENVIKNALNALNFFLVDFVMIQLNMKMKWILRKIIKLIVIKLSKFVAEIVKIYNLQKKIVINVKLNLLGIFVVFVIYLMIITKQNKYFIVMVVEFVEQGEEITSSIVIYAVAVFQIFN